MATLYKTHHVQINFFSKKHGWRLFLFTKTICLILFGLFSYRLETTLDSSVSNFQSNQQVDIYQLHSKEHLLSRYFNMAIIKLQSSDGEIFAVDVDVAKKSCTIRTMLVDLNLDEPSEDDVVPLPNVTSKILRKVIDWSTYHKDDPEVDEESDEYQRTNEIKGWDVDFFNMEQATLLELVMAANYLDVKGLLDTACKAVANLFIGKTPEEIRKTFNVKNDFTPAEEEQAKKETLN